MIVGKRFQPKVLVLGNLEHCPFQMQACITCNKAESNGMFETEGRQWPKINFVRHCCIIRQLVDICIIMQLVDIPV